MPPLSCKVTCVTRIYEQNYRMITQSWTKLSSFLTNNWNAYAHSLPHSRQIKKKLKKLVCVWCDCGANKRSLSFFLFSKGWGVGCNVLRDCSSRMSQIKCSWFNNVHKMVATNVTYQIKTWKTRMTQFSRCIHTTILQHYYSCRTYFVMWVL